jgi:hypothetical protein
MYFSIHEWVYTNGANQLGIRCGTANFWLIAKTNSFSFPLKTEHPTFSQLHQQNAAILFSDDPLGCHSSGTTCR